MEKRQITHGDKVGNEVADSIATSAQNLDASFRRELACYWQQQQTYDVIMKVIQFTILGVTGAMLYFRNRPHKSCPSGACGPFSGRQREANS